jgi:hypothetical protein
MKEIPVMIQGCVYNFIVDDDDYEYLSQFHWSGMKNNTGQVYASTTVQGVTYLLHRLVMHDKLQPGMVVDHMSRNSLNCCKANLRVTTQRENIRNSTKCDNAKGVHYDKQRRKWFAQARDHTGKKLNLGRYPTEQQAIEAYENFKRNNSL